MPESMARRLPLISVQPSQVSEASRVFGLFETFRRSFRQVDCLSCNQMCDVWLFQEGSLHTKAFQHTFLE